MYLLGIWNGALYYIDIFSVTQSILEYWLMKAWVMKYTMLVSIYVSACMHLLFTYILVKLGVFAEFLIVYMRWKLMCCRNFLVVMSYFVCRYGMCVKCLLEKEGVIWWYSLSGLHQTCLWFRETRLWSVISALYEVIL